jgi:glutamate-ammonia-ligase adenylyltransferase
MMLDNFVKAIKTRPLASIWYNEFINEVFLSSFLKICERSQKSINLMLIDKMLGDFLLNRKAFINELEKYYDDFTVVQFVFILSIQYCLELIDQNQTSILLTNFLKYTLIQLLKKENLPYEYFIIGLGSFGTKEMTFSSDMDIIIVDQNVADNPGIETDFQNALLRINKILKPFEVDVRLRPEGKSSQLVWDINTYYEYFQKRIQNWELQALTRVDFIYGNPDLFNSFMKAVIERIQKVNKDKLKADIIEMRNKVERQVNSSPQANFGNFFSIKKSKGGLNDISFSLQFLILKYPQAFNDCQGKDTFSIIKYFNKTLNSLDCYNSLEYNYVFLKKLELTMQLLFDSSNSVIPVDKQKKLFLAKTLDKNIQDFDKELTGTLITNVNCFEKILANG